MLKWSLWKCNILSFNFCKYFKKSYNNKKNQMYNESNLNIDIILKFHFPSFIRNFRLLVLFKKKRLLNLNSQESSL